MTVSAASTSQSSALVVDPTSAIIDAIAKLDPQADRTELAALIAEVVPQQGRRAPLAEQLDAGPDLLTGAGAQGSPVVVKLIEGLLARHVAGVVAPACPFCARIVTLSRGRDGLRCCKCCWDAAHAKPCARCGKVGKIDRRTSEGEGLCAACCRTEPTLLEPCSGCGRLRIAARRDGDLVLCQACCTPPSAICSGCGKRKPCLYANSEAPRCKNCSDKLRTESCSGCGRDRVVSRRTDTAQPLCKECSTTDTCAHCRRRRPIRAHTEKGALCQTCYKQDSTSHRTCQRCGTVERLHHHGLCAACSWHQVLRKSLTPSNGAMRLELEPVVAALAATNPRTGLNWMARASKQRVLTALAEATGPVTHTLLDTLAPQADAEHLRTVLIDCGVLSTRDELLISAERSIERRVVRVENPDDRKILHSFATWHRLRYLRANADRRPLTQDQVTYACNTLTASAHLLNWLRARGKNLTACTQDDIDEWLTRDTFSRARGFVSWAVRGGHARSIEIPRFKNEPTREVFSDHDRRWALARRLLAEDTVALTDRVAGLLVLLYAQRVTKITRLTTNQVTHTDHGVEILLGGQPIAVPSTFADLISNLIAGLPDNTVGGPGAWLFPGSRRGQPLSPKVLLRRLAGLGIPATIGRNSALIELAAEMPAAVISGLLGISIDRATRWTQDAGNTRPSYAAEVANRVSTPRKGPGCSGSTPAPPDGSGTASSSCPDLRVGQGTRVDRP